jgi:hypothetical protein
MVLSVHQDPNLNLHYAREMLRDTTMMLLVLFYLLLLIALKYAGQISSAVLTPEEAVTRHSVRVDQLKAKLASRTPQQ